jgi:hypothetical protein
LLIIYPKSPISFVFFFIHATKPLALINGENSEYRQYAKFVCTWHEFLIGENSNDIDSLREVLQTEKLPVSLMSDILKDAETIARFPTQLEGIDTVIEMLRQAIEKAQ